MSVFFPLEGPGVRGILFEDYTQQGSGAHAVLGIEPGSFTVESMNVTFRALYDHFFSIPYPNSVPSFLSPPQHDRIEDVFN